MAACLKSGRTLAIPTCLRLDTRVAVLKTALEDYSSVQHFTALPASVLLQEPDLAAALKAGAPELESHPQHGSTATGFSFLKGWQSHPVSQLSSPESDFNDPQAAFASKTSSALLRSLCTLRACRIQPLVKNAETLLKLSRSCLGAKITNSIVEATIFNHFCAGTNAETIKPRLSYLRQRGLVPILNYAAEADVDQEKGGKEFTMDSECGREEARIQCNVHNMRQAISDCDNTTPSQGFVCGKVTALAHADLLQRMSAVLAESGSLLDRGHNSSNLATLMAANLSPPDYKAFLELWQRLDSLASAVHRKGNMRLMIDAEQTYMQPAIDGLIISLQQKYNREGVVIMNTYQLYLKCSAARIKADMERASREGWKWGAKAVRGAYIHQERALAEEHGHESPIHDTLADTHDNYDSCVHSILKEVAKGGPELMVASHNQASAESALKTMRDLGLTPNDPKSGVYFGQLLGMADNLSYPLGGHGYNTYKLCAYGSVPQTIAFLLRRALENSDALGGVSKEIDMIKSELLRRVTTLRPGTQALPQDSTLQHA